MDRFASITAFLRLAQSGGFSTAGRRLNLSKATVSDRVQALKNAIGVRLLNRTTRQVSLTEIGVATTNGACRSYRTWRSWTRPPERNNRAKMVLALLVP